MPTYSRPLLAVVYTPCIRTFQPQMLLANGTTSIGITGVGDGVVQQVPKW